tara:strand:- start:704 stop:934 length:231 start_codon:yes stop_codon:yes gene_type:complete
MASKSEADLKGSHVRIVSGSWAGETGHMMGGDYGQDEGICVVKLDRKDQGLDCPGVGTYVYVHPDNIGTDNEKGGE